jgi:peptidoglycan/xylan/chitin deacetylase (PgdA/CDA1 family)
MIGAAPRRLRSAAKHAAERLLLASGIPRIARRRHTQDVLILAYHNIVPDDAPACGEESLHLPRSRFAAQLDMLGQTHDVVPLAEALDSRSAAGGRPRAVITFDDAYQGALTLGVDELVRRDLPATVFVAPRFVGGAPFWWDSIIAPIALDGGESFRSRALREAAGRDAGVRELAARRGLDERDVPLFGRCATEAQLSDAVARARITLGSHSWSHANLAALPTSELRDELTRPMSWLRDRWSGVLPVLAYPYGSVSRRVVEAARDAGYSAALRIEGGWLRTPGREPLLTPRVEVPARMTTAGFALRTAGLLVS